MAIKSYTTKAQGKEVASTMFVLEVTIHKCHKCKKKPALLWNCPENKGWVCKKCGWVGHEIVVTETHITFEDTSYITL